MQPNRKAQAIVTGAAVVVTGLATSFISIPTAVAAAAAWWLTGKLAKKR